MYKDKIQLQILVFIASCLLILVKRADVTPDAVKELENILTDLADKV